MTTGKLFPFWMGSWRKPFYNVISGITQIRGICCTTIETLFTGLVAVTTHVAFMQWWQLQHTWSSRNGGSYNTRGLHEMVAVTTHVAFMQWWQLQHTWPSCNGGSYNTRGLHTMVSVTTHVAFTQWWLMKMTSLISFKISVTLYHSQKFWIFSNEDVRK